MEHVKLGLGARTFLIAASLSLAACSSVSDDSLSGQDSNGVIGQTTASAEPVITVAPTVQIQDSADAVDELDNAEAVAAPTTAAPTPTTEPPTTVLPSTTEAAVVAGVDAEAGEDIELAAAAQLQDDDDATEQLPNTGPNETMLVIAIGCALIVGGRTLVDLVNSAARAMQRLPARTRSNPPR